MIRLLGDFDLAEEALHDGFASELELQRESVPQTARVEKSEAEVLVMAPPPTRLAGHQFPLEQVQFVIEELGSTLLNKTLGVTNRVL